MVLHYGTERAFRAAGQCTGGDLSLIHISARETGVDYTFHDFARILAEDCEKIDFIFVTPQVLVKSCEIPAEVPEALL